MDLVVRVPLLIKAPWKAATSAGKKTACLVTNVVCNLGPQNDRDRREAERIECLAALWKPSNMRMFTRHIVEAIADAIRHSQDSLNIVGQASPSSSGSGYETSWPSKEKR